MVAALLDDQNAEIRASEERTPLWQAVDALVDSARSFGVLRSHRLHLLAGARLRARGAAVPEDVAAEQRTATLMGLLAPLVLAQAVEAYDGHIALFKGPEVAVRYPDRDARPFGDLDLLVDDAAAAQRALLAAGFVEVGEEFRYRGIHHLRPLAHPDLPIPIELHQRPKWVSWCAPPATRSLLDAAVPSRTGVEGLLALAPAQHALVLAAHSWAHEPLRRALDLVDVAAVAEAAQPNAVEALAAEWGIARLWETTTRTAQGMLGFSRPGREMRSWARNLKRLDERTVLESHVESWLSPFSVRPVHLALAGLPRAVVDDLTPDAREPWSRKLRRARRALRHAKRPRSEHDARVEEAGVSGPPAEDRLRR